MLVTGVNGFIASNIADKFLRFGYKVRGTTRNPEKNAWVTNLFDRKYGPGNFELVAVPDTEAESAYDQVMKGIFILTKPCNTYHGYRYRSSKLIIACHN